jgi:hypothetical protein
MNTIDLDTVALEIAESALAEGILDYAVREGFILGDTFELTEADVDYAAERLGPLDPTEIRYVQRQVREILSDRVADLRWVEEA